MLSDAQIQQYQRDGHVIPDFRLSDQEIDEIASAHVQQTSARPPLKSALARYDRLLAKHPEFTDYCPAVGGALAMSERTLCLMRGQDLSGQNDFRIRA